MEMNFFETLFNSKLLSLTHSFEKEERKKKSRGLPWIFSPLAEGEVGKT